MIGATSVPVAPERSKSHTIQVRLDVVHKIQEIADGVNMVVWSFSGLVPGPTIRVRQGDRIHFTMANRSNETAKFTAPMPHSMDFHAAMINPEDKYRSISPGQSLEYEFSANYAGVFMYHCGTPMVLHHVAMGMYGMVIVEPKGGYPTRVDREFVIVQSEFYPDMSAKPSKDTTTPLDMKALTSGTAPVFTFNGKAFQYQNSPLTAKPGERVRLFFLNAGPKSSSSFHIVGTIFDRVWLNGNPLNELHGMQAILSGPANSAIFEFIIPESGKYMMMDHDLGHANSGAMGFIDASNG
jgi:nitrite reductase (NO-forming)